MRRLIPLLLLIFLVLNLPLTHAQEDNRFPLTITDASGREVTIESDATIVSGSGDVTEILVALGYRENLVGIDSTATYPPELLDEIEVIGFGRRLAAEPVINLAPDIFFCTQVCGPEDVLEQIREVGIAVVIIPDNETDGLRLLFMKIDMISAALGIPEAGEMLKAKLELELEWVKVALANTEGTPTVFHPYVRGRGLQLAAGSGTPADVMITAAGGHNAAVDAGVEGYAPLSAELIFAAYPDILLLAEGNVEASGGLENIIDEQGLRDTPAVQNEQIVVIDTQLLLAMSIRTGEALMILAHAFHPDMTWELAVEYPYSYTDATGIEQTLTVAPDILYTTDETLFDFIRRLGFHVEMFEDTTTLPDGAWIVTTEETDWQAWRDAGITTLVISDVFDLSQLATALNVPGRGTALQVYLGE